MRSLPTFAYTEVPGLGTVIFSPNAISGLQDGLVTTQELEDTLELGTDTKAFGEAYSGVREYQGIRLEIRTRRHIEGAAAVVVNGYRVRS